MSAADLLRTAVDDAPLVTIVRDAMNDAPSLAIDPPYRGRYIVSVALDDGEVAALRLIGLLLAAAPHLADLLDAVGTEPAHNLQLGTIDALAKVQRAVTEAGESL